MSKDIYIIREVPGNYFWCENFSKVSDSDYYKILSNMYEKALEKWFKNPGEIVPIDEQLMCITPADNIKDAIRIYEEQLI